MFTVIVQNIKKRLSLCPFLSIALYQQHCQHWQGPRKPSGTINHANKLLKQFKLHTSFVKHPFRGPRQAERLGLYAPRRKLSISDET